MHVNACNNICRLNDTFALFDSRVPLFLSDKITHDLKSGMVKVLVDPGHVQIFIVNNKLVFITKRLEVASILSNLLHD